jgi:hypothetical protein
MSMTDDDRPGRPAPDTAAAWAAFREGLKETNRAAEAYRNSNAALAQAAFSAASRRGRNSPEAIAAMTLAPILRGTPDLASARAALDTAEVSERDRALAVTLLENILASRDDPRAHPRAK